MSRPSLVLDPSGSGSPRIGSVAETHKHGLITSIFYYHIDLADVKITIGIK